MQADWESRLREKGLNVQNSPSEFGYPSVTKIGDNEWKEVVTMTIKRGSASHKETWTFIVKPDSLGKLRIMKWTAQY
jgi:hypothetical protein